MCPSALACLSQERIARFPLINQMASQMLTLQGAIAHSDMSIECGPTRFAPYTQQFQKGYMTLENQEYTDYVDSRMVQLPLMKGDAVFFNPACLHQPGQNTSGRPRVANLLQISACWGTPMETTNKLVTAKSLWPTIRKWFERAGDNETGIPGTVHPLQIDALIQAACDDFGYPAKFDLLPVRSIDHHNRHNLDSPLRTPS